LANETPLDRFKAPLDPVPPPDELLKEVPDVEDEPVPPDRWSRSSGTLST
jgi:hypothetical protein